MSNLCIVAIVARNVINVVKLDLQDIHEDDKATFTNC